MSNNISPQTISLSNVYDSHVHWEGTGAKESALDLSQLKSPKDIFNVQPSETHFRGVWLVGYNWDQSHWRISENPHRKTLDAFIHKGPILLHRADRHAAWVNTEALKLAGLYRRWDSPNIDGGVIHLDDSGYPTGYVVDRAMDIIKTFIPDISKSQIYNNLKVACRVFNQAGYTHIRDLTCSEQQWEQTLKLYENKELTLAVEQFFDFDGNEPHQAIALAKHALSTAPEYVKVKGIKIFYDGALGSEGALLSCPYHGAGHNKGFALYEKQTLKDILRQVYENNLEAAVHVIGDQAAEDVVSVAYELKYNNGYQKNKRLHLEHAELLRPETIQRMKALDVICHIQPCHWLTDKVWVDQKLGALKKHLFRWRALEEQNIPFDFGSDSPIEPASVLLNLKAMEDAASQGIEKTKHFATHYMQHKEQWLSNCKTHFDNQYLIKQTIFNGHLVYDHQT